MLSTLLPIWDRMRTLAALPSARRMGAWLRVAFVAGILTYLALRFTEIGWREIASSLPTHPLFYLIFLFQYFCLPLTEYTIYRSMWRIPFRSGFPMLLKKRVYNKDVLGYSGEVYLYTWLKRRMGLRDREAISTLKDHALVSAATSTAFGGTVLAALLLSGRLAVFEGFVRSHAASIFAVAVLVGVVALLVARFRRVLFQLPARRLGLIAGVHFGRHTVLSVLQVVQWAVVLPGIGIDVWFTFLAMQIVTSRIPLLPARDAVFLGAGLQLSLAIDVPTAGIASMLLLATIMDKALNLVLFASVSWFGRAGHRKNVPPDAATPLVGVEGAEEEGVVKAW